MTQVELETIELAYLAGIIDGEGCISVSYTYGKNKPYPRALLKVAMCDKAPINALKLFFGGRVEPQKVYGPQRPQWIWRVHGAQARGILTLLLPYLRVKGPQAELALELQSLKARSYFRKGAGPGNKAYCMPRQWDVMAELRALNRG